MAELQPDTNDPALQIAALPYRIRPDGVPELLLVTSRETRRWVVPKGNPIPGLSPHQSAAREAFEEAGISGLPCPAPIGNFHYDKRLKGGSVRPTRVGVYPLAVLKQYPDWPEREQREARWFSLADAAAVVAEPELRALILEFREPPKTTGPAERALLWVRRSGEWVSGLRWLQALKPSQDNFFDLFEAHAAILVEGADALARLLQGGDTIAQYCAAVQAHEHLADEVTRQVLQDVRRTAIPPFNRAAITSLIRSMDDSIDQMNQAAKAITIYQVSAFAEPMQDMSSIIVEAARIAAEAMPLLRSLRTNANRLHALTDRLVQIEGTADDIHEAGLKALFKNYSNARSIDFIVGREIYGHLERVVDAFEDVANEIQGLVIDQS